MKTSSIEFISARALINLKLAEIKPTRRGSQLKLFVNGHLNESYINGLECNNETGCEY